MARPKLFGVSLREPLADHPEGRLHQAVPAPEGPRRAGEGLRSAAGPHDDVPGDLPHDQARGRGRDQLCEGRLGGHGGTRHDKGEATAPCSIIVAFIRDEAAAVRASLLRR